MMELLEQAMLVKVEVKRLKRTILQIIAFASTKL
jgi:hypothetical protein